jgi:nitronate monooxygenase
MLNIAMPSLAVSVFSAGGLGFLAAGYDVSSLEPNLQEAVGKVDRPDAALHKRYCESGILPIGVGFLNWGADIKLSVAAIK